MQPLQYDLRSPAAKDNSITYAAKAGSNLAIPFTLREGYYSCKSQLEFHWQLIHQRHLQTHLHCGNDPTVAIHNGILSTAHRRNTVETPFTMRNRSETDPTMIRP